MAGHEYFDIIAPFVEARTVLDVGSINHSFVNRARSKDWVHDLLVSRSRRVTGIDLARPDVLRAREAGYDIRHADAETYVCEDGPYDVVFAGDLIEHLSNPGAFLACANRNLHDEGRLVLVTPNTYGLRELFLVVSRLTNDPPVHQQHTAYFTPTTLRELARRHGFEVETVAYANIRYRGRSRWTQALLALNHLLTRPFPTARQTLVMVFRKARPVPLPRAARGARKAAAAPLAPSG